MILLELSMVDLINKSEQAFPDTAERQHATDEIRVTNTTFTPSNEGLIVKCEVTNTNKGSKYLSTILFSPVEMKDAKEGNVVEFVGSDGAKHYLTPINSNATDVKVNCTCLDFHFRFATWNFSNDSLLGQKPEPYQKKPGSNRPPANPKQSPGVCKHLMKAFEEVKAKRIVN